MDARVKAHSSRYRCGAQNGSNAKLDFESPSRQGRQGNPMQT
jgi:hypothetical protein